MHPLATVRRSEGFVHWQQGNELRLRRIVSLHGAAGRRRSHGIRELFTWKLSRPQEASAPTALQLLSVFSLRIKSSSDSQAAWAARAG